jgi:hypothetical protein
MSASNERRSRRALQVVGAVIVACILVTLVGFFAWVRAPKPLRLALQIHAPAGATVLAGGAPLGATSVLLDHEALLARCEVVPLTDPSPPIGQSIATSSANLGRFQISTWLLVPPAPGGEYAWHVRVQESGKEEQRWVLRLSAQDAAGRSLELKDLGSATRSTFGAVRREEFLSFSPN